MPGMDGLEAIKKILQVSCDSKIIMVSAVTSEKVIQQAMKTAQWLTFQSLSAERMWKTVLGNAMHT